MNKNWPDRIKLSILAVVLAPFFALMFFLLLFITGVFQYIPLNVGISIIIIIAVSLDVFYIYIKFKQLLLDELNGNIPDVTLINNANMTQTIGSIIIVILMLIAYINYLYYSMVVAKVLLLICILAAIIEIVVIRTNKSYR